MLNLVPSDSNVDARTAALFGKPAPAQPRQAAHAAESKPTSAKRKHNRRASNQQAERDAAVRFALEAIHKMAHPPRAQKWVQATERRRSARQARAVERKKKAGLPIDSNEDEGEAAAPSGAPLTASNGGDAAAEAPSTSVAAAVSAESAERLERTVFVGNVPPATKRLELQRHFSSFGKVESVRIRSAASAPKISKKAAVITGNIDTSIRDGVNAYIVFASADAVEAAIDSNGKFAFGRHLRVDAATRGERTPGTARRSVFLGNLPFDVQDEAIWRVFSECGKVEYVRIVRDANTQQGKGFGYVCFESKGSVEMALERHETKLFGRAIRVQRCKAHTASAEAKGDVGAGREWKKHTAAALRLKLTATAKARKKHKPGAISKAGKAGKKAKKSLKGRGKEASRKKH